MKLIYEFNKSLWVFKSLMILLLMSVSSGVFSQTPGKITVIGTVVDSDNLKMPFVNITVEGSKIGTRTDNNGRFVLDVEDGKVLKISYVGFKEQKITVSSKNKIFTIMLKAENTLEEVVITAFGKKERKEAIVGSVTSIKPAELKIPSSNLTNALAGQASGIIAYQRSGQPGQDNASFFVRGVTTFGYKKDPLILIDNVELTTSDLARLQVDDIASFSILKDASATALYGARGANGVILVSTKEGKDGETKINFRSEYSASQSTQTLDIVDPITYMNLYNEATLTRDPKLSLPFSPTKIRNTQAAINGVSGSNAYAYPAVDWLDLMFKKQATTQRNNLSVSGGGGVARFYVAGSYNNDNGVLNQDSRNNNDNNVNFKNYQLRSNVNINLTKTTELIVRLSGTFSEYNGPVTIDGSFASDLYNAAIHTSPVLFPAYYPADAANANTQHILFGNQGIGSSGTATNNIQYNNPYAMLLRGHKNSSESRMSAQMEVNQDFKFITEGLKFKGIFNTNRYSYFDSQLAYSPFYYNYDTYDKQTNQYSLLWLNPQATGNNVATEYLSYSRGEPNLNTFIYLQGALDYNKQLGNHNISATLIGTGQQTVYSSARDPKLNIPTLQYSLPYRNLGLAARATYAYKSRYFIESNFGYNGSERFSENHRFGFFPTIGASWVTSNEKFWNSKFIDRLKLRGSFGLVGNDAIGSQRFFYLSDVSLNNGPNYAQFGTNNQYERKGVFINNYENADVTWETSKQTNLALEMTLLKKLNIVAEVYKNHRYDILQERKNTPSTEGLETYTSANIGAVDSKGIDFSVDYKQTFSKGAWASIRSNLTYSTNKYKYIEEPNYKESWRHFIGQPISRGYGYIAERLFVDDIEAKNSPTQILSTTDAWGNVTKGTLPRGGDIKYRDVNTDGKIDNLDLVFMGYPQTPEVVYGFGFSSGFKGFDLSAFFQGQARVSFFIDPTRVSPFVPSPDRYVYGNTQVLTDFADNHWSEENQNLYATYPRLGTTTASITNNIQPSTWWLRDASFLRLKSLEIGYTLPARISRSMKLSNCRVYFNGLNLLTLSPFKMWDPEQGGNGFAYPIQKVFNIGLNLNL